MDFNFLPLFFYRVFSRLEYRGKLLIVISIGFILFYFFFWEIQCIGLKMGFREKIEEKF